jgi:hypothetical protein
VGAGGAVLSQANTQMTAVTEPDPRREERLRLDYGETTDLLRSLTDVRFKLLALVPTLTGTAVAVIGRPRPAAELLGVGVLGLVATVGVLLYDLRNTQIYDYAVRRAGELESKLGLGGLFAERPSPTLRPFGLPPATYDHALALVYGAALAGWTYLVAWGALHALGIGGARKGGAAIGVLAGLLVMLELLRLSAGAGKQKAPQRVLSSMDEKQDRVRPEDIDLLFDDEEEAVEAHGQPPEADDDEDDVEAHGSWGTFG